MKTNVILKSSDRDLFDIVIRQDTKNQFLSITDLQKAYDKARVENEWGERAISDVLFSSDTKKRIYYLLKERGIINTSILRFMEMAKEKGIVDLLKRLDQWKTTGRAQNKQAMCDPYIWVLIAMEMNPMLYAKVVIWLTDSLIFNRIKAGDEYLPMNRAISNVVEEPQYAKYAMIMNKKVFGKHETGIRNTASSEDLDKISQIEKYVSKLIESKLITTEDQIIEQIVNY